MEIQIKKKDAKVSTEAVESADFTPAVGTESIPQRSYLLAVGGDK